MNTRNSSRSRYLSAAVSAVLSFAAASTQAGPQSGNVTQGAATISTPAGNITQIDQTTNSVSIDWQSFDVAANESVNFNQPSASSVAMNRILTQDPSQILGSINANGRIFLLNPNGIIFGASARVNVGSLVASSLDLTDADAAAGRYSFATAAERSGAVINNGTLTAASGGSITLLGGSVLNTGLIVADYGTVNLGAGRAATLSFDGDGLMRFQIDAGLLTDTDGVSAAVNNSGEIAAAGGQVVLTAQQASDVVAQAVNNDGVIRASRVENTGGVIRLVGSGGTVVNSGTLDATGSNGTGGEIAVLGENVALTGTALVDVSGTHGGGTAFVGGGFAGADPALLNAQNTTVDAGAVIRADSTTSGDAGRIAVWADDTTTFNGQVLARASGASGDGGFIEVSGRESLLIGGSASTTSVHGALGTLLLDPGSVRIIDGTNGDNASPNVFTDGWINNQLNSNNVTIETSTAATGPETLAIEGGVAISWNGDATLALDAGESVTMAASSSITNTAAGGDVGNLQIRSGLLATPTDGSITLNGTVSVAGNLSLTASGSTGAIATSGSLTVDGTSTLNAGSTVTLGPITTGVLGVTAGANIAQTGVLNVSGISTLSAAGNDITLNQANVFTGGVGVTAEDVSLTAAAATALRASTVTGNLSVTTTTGAITQSGAVTAGSTTLNAAGGVAINSTLNAGTSLTVTAGGPITQSGTITTSGLASFTTRNDTGAAITLNAANSFGSVEASVRDAADATDAAAGISITEANDTMLAGSLRTAADQIVFISSSGNIEQSGAVSAAGNVRLDAAGSITLADTANSFTGSISLNAASASASLTNSTATDLGTSTVAGALAVTSTGDITQSGGMAIGGVSTFTASGQDITLGPYNTFAGGIGVTADSASLEANTAIDLLASNVGGNFSVTTTGGGITQSGAVTVTGAATLDSAAGVTLGAFSAGALDVTARGAISQTNAATVTGQATFTTLNDGGADISLTNSGNTFGSVQASVRNLGNTADANGAIAITESGNTQLAGNLSTATGQTVTIISTGNISQSGVIASAGNISLTADGSITLTSGNQLTGSVSLDAVSASLTNTTATSLGASTIDSSLTVDSTGAINQTGAINVIGGSTNLSSDAAVALTTINTGALTINAGGAVTQSGGALNVTGNSIVNASGQDVTLNAANTFGGNIAVTAANAVLTNSTATTLSASTIANNLTVNSSSGALIQTGALDIGGTTTLVATDRDVTLSDATNTFGGGVAVSGANVTLADADSIDLRASTVSGNLAVTADIGTITQSGALNVTGNSTFTANAGQSILLGEANTFTGTVAFVGNSGNLNDVTLRDSNAIDLQALTLDGDLNVTATSGAITQSGAFDIGGTATFTAADGQSISLVNTANDFTGVVTFVGDGGNLTDVSVFDASALTLGGLSLDGNLSVNADSIAQSGALIIGGNSTFTASGGQSIDLDNAGNAFTGTVGFAPRSGTLQNVSITDTTALDLQALAIGGNLTASASSLTQSGALLVGGTATLTSGTGIALNTTSADALHITASGAVTQTGDLTITGATTIDADGQNVTLTRTDNAFGGSIAVTAATASLTNSGATTLGASTLDSNLTVDSTGAINQTGAISVIGGSTNLSSDAAVALTTINTGTLTIGAGGAVTQSGGALNVTGNSIVNASGQDVTLNATNTFGGNIAVTAANAVLTNSTATTLGASTIANNLTVNSSSGALTQTGAISVAGDSTFNAAGQDVTLTAGNTLGGDIRLTAANASLTNTVATNLQSSTITNNLTVNSSSGALTQTGALDIGGTTTLVAGAQNVTLGDVTNTFGGGVAVNGANVTLADADSIDLRASTVSGNLAVTAVAGTITQSGALNVTGSSTFTAADGQSVLLTNATNTFGGGVTLNSAGTLNDVSLTAATNLDLLALTIGGDLIVDAANLTQSGTLAIGGAATLTSGGALALNTTSADALTINAGGPVTQSGALTIAGDSTFNASGQSITLNAAGNAFTGSIAIDADATSLTNSVDTTIATSTLGSSLNVDSTGAITQAGTINVAGGSTTLTSDAAVALAAINTGTLTIGAGGPVTQSAGTLNVSGNTVFNAAGQNVTLNAANALTGSVAVTAANASLTNTTATNLGTSTLSGNLTVDSAGAVTQSGPVSVGGTATFDAAGQDVTLASAGNQFVGGVTLTATNASLSNSIATNLQSSTITNNLTVNSIGALTQNGTLDVNGGTATLNSGGAVSLNTINAGSLSATAGGAVTQSGALNISGNTALAAAGQNVTLDDTANQFGGGVAVTGANVTLADADSIDLRASTVSGGLDVTAVAGTITQSGALNVTGSSTFTAADGQSILLTDATNIFGGVRLASSGQLDNVALAAASSLDLQGLDITGDLVVTTGGSLTQSGTLVVAGDADFHTLNAGSNIALNGANQFGSVSATGAGGVAITQGTGDLNLRQVTAAGSARLEATGGSIVDDAADPSAASVSAASVELVALDNIGTVTDLLTRQGTSIAVNTNGGSLAAHVTSTNGQINLSLPGGSAPVAAAGAISAGGSGRLLIQSTGDLSLNAFNSAITGFSEIGFSADGTLNVPGAQSDLTAGPLATLYLRGGVDIARADRTFNLSASHLIFDSASQGGDVTLNIDADRIDALVGGGASMTVQDANDLTLGTISASNNVTIGAANIRDDGDAGSVTRVTAGNTITLNASAGIGAADGVGGGRIDTAANGVSVNASAGSVYLSHAGDLQISGNAAAGAIDVVAPTGNVTVTSTLRANGPLTLVAGTVGSVTGNITLAGTAQSTGIATLTAANGGTLSDANDAAAHLVAQSATLSAAGVGSQANALGVEVGALSAGVSGDLYVNAVNAIQLRTIDAATVAVSATGAIGDDGDNTTRLTAQSVSLSGTSVGATGVGGEIDTTTDRLSASASAGGIYVGESGDLQLAALSASGIGNSIVVRAEGAITDDGDAATRVSGGSLALTGTSIGAAGTAIDTQVTLLNATASSGGVFINEVDDLQINTVTGTDVVLTAAGALTDDGNDSTRVTGTSIRLNAARIGTSDNRVDTAAGSLDAIATAGGIYFAEQDDAALGEVRSSGTGNTVDGRTGGNGNMTVQTLVTQGGAVNLTAGGTGSITVTGAIESNNGVVNLISGNALALPGLDTGTGSVVLRTVNDLNVGTINASSVSITSDTGNVSLGTINATGGTVTVSANNGAITDGDATSLTARDATLSARTIGGPDQALNLAVDNLTATASAGGIYVNDIGGVTLNAVNATGAVSIVTTGALTQAVGIASGGGDIDIFAESILMQAGATTLSGNGNISYVANNGAVSLEVIDAGAGRALVIASDSVYTTLDANSGINNLSGSAVEIRAGGLFGGAGEIGTISNPINIATPGSSGRSVYLIVPAMNGIQTTTPFINYSSSAASHLLKGYTGSTGALLFDMSSTFSPETILSGDETIVPLANGRVAVNSDSLSAAKQALSSGVITRVNVDWAAFDPNVSLFGTLDPSLRLPADQIDEEIPTASLIPEGTVLSMTRDGWELKREI